MADQQRDLFDVEPAPWELDDAAEQSIATVIFPEAPSGAFTYRIPVSLQGEVRPGCRVRVPLGRGNRTVLGYCVEVGQQTSSAHRLKEVRSVIDPIPLISPSILKLTRWMSDYYFCQWGPILEAVVPAGVRGQAGTREVTFLHVPTNVAARLTKWKLPVKQAEALKYIAAASQGVTPAEVAKAVGCTTAPINGLRKKGLVQAETRRIYSGQYDEEQSERTEPWPMNDDQQRALDGICQVLHAGHHETVLLHGVTGSGKTEVYIRAIKEVTGFGRQAIVLVPEISLTPQTRRRFRSRLSGVAVLHSHLSPAERHWQWQRIARGEVQVVVGARSAVFAPTPHLGLIVMDEEHEPSFKQDTAPRYHARDVAFQRAAAEGVPLILGSATPALESWHRAKNGQYRLIEMPRRVLNRPLPDVVTIDLRTESRDRMFRGAISRRLHHAVEQTLKDDGQVILLLNRRGFSTHIQCPACGEVVRCQECEISLTHHRDAEKAICHYCNFQMDTPPVCPDCGFDGIRFGGLGTQRLENEVRARYGDYPSLRMDSDTMRRHGSHEEALEKFRRGEVRILLGTQMIAKGLDFPNVTLVGVINADVALHLPDFRAGERTFQLVTQVAGRTGRGEKGGRVLVQTYSPEHAAIVASAHHDYTEFAQHELATRQEYGYPPFSQVIRMVFRSESESKVQQFAETFAERLAEQLVGNDQNVRILGPVPAPIVKLRGKFRFHLLVQASDGDTTRAAIRSVADGLPRVTDVQWIVDVDAISML